MTETALQRRSPVELETLVRTHAGSLSAHELATLSGYSPATIRGLASRLGISLLVKPELRKSLPPSPTDRFLRRPR